MCHWMMQSVPECGERCELLHVEAVWGVDYDATDDSIRSSYLRLALVGESASIHALLLCV